MHFSEGVMDSLHLHYYIKFTLGYHNRTVAGIFPLLGTIGCRVTMS